MTTAEAAVVLSVTVRRVRQLIAAGRLRAEKVGRDWSIAPEALEAVKHRRAGRPAQKQEN